MKKQFESKVCSAPDLRQEAVASLEVHPLLTKGPDQSSFEQIQN